MPHCPSADEFTSFADRWTLNPTVAMLNHGSFGACPREVLDLQSELRAELERRPVPFFDTQAQPLLDQSRAELAALLDSDPDDLVFVHNATAGVNSVLRSLSWTPGDELLVTDHAYNACRNVADYLAARQGVVVTVARIAVPVAAPADVVDAILAAVTPRTRLAMIDHITSPTAIVFPIAEIVGRLAERGVDTLVDGAHAPGMVPVNMREIAAAYYTATCHKWLCAPKGAGFLYVRRDRQADIQPTIISHGYNTPRSGYPRLHDAFDWIGTDDPTPWLCVGAAIRFLDGLLPGGLAELRARNHALTLAARRLLCAAVPATPTCPESMTGSIAALCLPDDATVPADASPLPGFGHWLHKALREQYQIEVPVYAWPGPPRKIVRIAAQAYNHLGQYERLARALQDLLAPGACRPAADRVQRK